MTCIVVLGGSFDPVHNGHVALARHFIQLLQPDALRVIPAGNPWQKPPLQTPPEHRIAMLKLAFAKLSVPLIIDTREIERQGPSYSIDTLRELRAELGTQTSIVFLLGADQLNQLHTWLEWDELIDYANICAASRPGYAVAAHLPEMVEQVISCHAGTPDQIRTTSHGLAYLATNLTVDISSTSIRAALKRGDRPTALLPAEVLDYIQQHSLYR